MATFDEVNLANLFAQIEIDLLKNLTGSLASGNWRNQRRKAFREFQKRNRDILSQYNIDNLIKRELEAEYRAAGQRTKAELEQHGLKRSHTNHFKVDDKRMKALTAELQGNMRKVTEAARRQQNDRYRMGLAKTQTMLASNLYTLNQCVDTATKDFLAAGVNCIRYRNGRLVDIATYSEMALRTCNRRITLHAEGAMRADFGVYTVRISQYGACSDTCLPHQGKVHFDDVFAGGNPENNTDGYPLLSTAIAAGLFHPNCRHKSSTYYPGVSTEPEPLDEAEVKRKAALENKQRYNERQIRKYKRLEDCSQDPANQETYRRKVREWQARQRELIDNNPDALRRDYKREKVYSPTMLTRANGVPHDVSNFAIDSPVNVGQVDYSDKKAIMNVLESAREQYQASPFEVDCTVTSNGNVWVTKGTAGSVNPMGIETGFNIPLKGSYSYHNHPEPGSNYSLSGADIDFFLRTGTQYSEASDSKYRYWIERTEATWYDDGHSILEEFNRIERQIRFDDVAQENGLSHNIDETAFHLTCEKLSEKYQFAYRRVQND